MSTIHSVNNTPEAEASALSRSLILLLAVAAGLAVASLYYSQPMLSLLAAAFQTSDRAIGLVPTLTQLGYAAGIMLLIPLGDRYDRRIVILTKASALVLVLAFTGISMSYGFLLAACVITGLSATLAQDIVPAAAALAPSHKRGKIVGTVMTGLLLGILLSRVFSGIVAERFGWRAVYFISAAAVTLVTLVAWKQLPHFESHTQLSYLALLGSMKELWSRHGIVRRATLAQATLSIGFSAYWSSLAIMLHHTYHLGSSAAGAFGLVGAAGSIAAPFAGKLSDRRGPSMVAGLGCIIAAASFAVMWAMPLLSTQAQIVLLAVSAIGFDFGVQAALVAHQTIGYSVDPGARSRLNALLFTGMFLGMAIGSSLSTVLLARWGWMAVVTLSTAASVGALLIRSLPAPWKHSSHRTTPQRYTASRTPNPFSD